MKIDWKLLTTFIFSIGIVYILGVLFNPNCDDCFRPHGWPFPYYRDGGFAGGGHYVWDGILGDFLFAITASMLLWMGWNAALPHSTRIAERDIRRRTWGWIRLSYALIIIIDEAIVVTRQLSEQTGSMLVPSNRDQEVGMIIGYFAILCLAAWLAETGIRKIYSTPITMVRDNDHLPANYTNDHL
jgi:hypothetical protein